MTTNEIFNRYYENLMFLKKAEIVQEGVTYGFYNAMSADYLVKHYTKIQLARAVADRLTRKEVRGY